MFKSTLHLTSRSIHFSKRSHPFLRPTLAYLFEAHDKSVRRRHSSAVVPANDTQLPKHGRRRGSKIQMIRRVASKVSSKSQPQRHLPIHTQSPNPATTRQCRRHASSSCTDLVVPFSDNVATKQRDMLPGRSVQNFFAGDSDAPNPASLGVLDLSSDKIACPSSLRSRSERKNAAQATCSLHVCACV